MASPANTDEFLELVRKSGVADEKRFDAWLLKARAAGLPAKPGEAAGLLVRDAVLTAFQAEQILQGKWKRFTIGKYKVLEKLGAGGMGSVYLCEHKLMRRRVAVKVLPTAKAQDESALGRFYREARAVAALDHPNIVHAYDIDQDDTLHFLVMEYVDGASLQDIVKKTGPMDIGRACHYIHQAVLGLEHAHQASLIHRDIKPGNILVDRTGVVKILDMGLARFFNDEEDMLTKKFDENVLGTADYLAPEQAIDSHEVDIRADIYSLGATFYYMLTGRTPFGEGTVAQKLLWHQNRQPKPVTEFRPEVPPALAAVVAKMMAKDKAQRYQSPGEIAEALAPFAQDNVEPPPEAEMPRLSPAALGQQAPVDTQPTAIVKNTPPPVPKALQGMTSKGQPTPPPKGPATPTPPPGPSKAPPPGPGRVAANAPPSPAPKPVPKLPPRPAPFPAPAPLQPAPMLPAAPTVAQLPAAEPLEEAPWESLSSVDTEDLSAKADTSPQAGRSARSLKSGIIKDPRRAWWVFASIGVISMLVIGTLLVIVSRNRPGPAAPPRKTKTLEVTGSGKAGSFRSIFKALEEALPGDVIYLTDPEHRENLVLDGTKANITTDVTIAAAPDKDVVWKSASKDDKTPLLVLHRARDFKLRGVTFDGALDAKKQVKDLIVITGESPGLTIDDVTFKDFDRSGVNLVNLAGKKDKWVRLLNLRAELAPPKKAEAVVLFDAKFGMNPPQNDYIEVGSGHFRGVAATKEAGNAVNGKNVKLN